MAPATYTIIVPIFEETEALAFANFYYQVLGVTPIFVLDSKRSTRRAEVEKLLGRTVTIYENPGNCIEASYAQLAGLSPTDWVLRIDCDEVPNTALLAHAAKFVNHPSDIYCAYDRDDLIWRESHFEKLKYKPLFVDSQFRLFDRRKVTFNHHIHTPGFKVPKWKIPFLPGWNAPRDARIYHLQRVFITQQQRTEKLTRYNAAGQNSTFDTWLSRPDDSFKWRSLDDSAFTKIFAQWKETKAS